MATILHQVAGFSLVGACGALLDGWLFHRLTRRHPARHRIFASLVSTTCAMAWSFAANWLLVFRPGPAAPADRLGRFLVVTCFSGWVLQSAVIRAVDWLVAAAAQPPGIDHRQVRFVDTPAVSLRRSGSKVTAIAVGFVWNFCWYRGWVYAD